MRGREVGEGVKVVDAIQGCDEADVMVKGGRKRPSRGNKLKTKNNQERMQDDNQNRR